MYSDESIATQILASKFLVFVDLDAGNNNEGLLGAFLLGYGTSVTRIFILLHVS